VAKIEVSANISVVVSVGMVISAHIYIQVWIVLSIEAVYQAESADKAEMCNVVVMNLEWFDASMATVYNEAFSGSQLCQFGVGIWHFTDSHWNVRHQLHIDVATARADFIVSYRICWLIVFYKL
jgi:hypothetical protein